jgi:hypothetical protein
MTRIKTTPEVKDHAGILLANDMLVKSPNGRMFLKPEKANDDTFVQAVIKKQVSIVGGTVPVVWKEVAPDSGIANALICSDNSKAFVRIPITELKDKEKYEKEIAGKYDFDVTYEFLDKMVKADIATWASQRGIAVDTKLTKDKMINYILNYKPVEIDNGSIEGTEKV